MRLWFARATGENPPTPIRRIGVAVLTRCLPLAMMLLAGCATTPKAPEGDFDFRLDGRIGVKSEDTSFSASFSWTQAGKRYHIELWGPFGSSRIRLTGNARRLAVTTARGTASGLSPETLMQRELGWSVPLNALQYWVRGLPDPKAPSGNATTDGAGRLQSFDQHGWQLRIEGRHASAGDDPLPRRVVARRGGARIIIVCRTWQFPTGS